MVLVDRNVGDLQNMGETQCITLCNIFRQYPKTLPALLSINLQIYCHTCFFSPIISMNLGIETRIFVRHIVVSPQISTACLSVDRCAIYFICMTIGIPPVVEIGPFFRIPPNALLVLWGNSSTNPRRSSPWHRHCERTTNCFSKSQRVKCRSNYEAEIDDN